MRGIVRNSQFGNIHELVTAAQEASKENYRYQELFKNVVQSAFGKDGNRGIIADRVQYYFRQSPLQWADQLDELVKAFSPQGPLMSGKNSSSLISTADRSVPIDPKILPKSVLEEFSGSGDRQSSKIRSLRRQFSDKFYINNWEWYWCHVAYALSTQSDIEDKRSFSEDQSEDELFVMLSRNPLLIIVRKGLTFNYKKESYLMERMRGIFQLYLIEDLFLTTKRKDKKLADSKYHLKSHYLAAIYLLIHSRRGKFTGQTFQIYDQFFVRASEYYSSITSQSHGQNVRIIIRVWLYLMTRQHSLDSMLVSQTENANPKDGWYRLSRCPLRQWVKAIRKVEFQSYELPLVAGMKKSVYKLIARQTEWTPSFAFLAVIEQFLQFDETAIARYIRNENEKEENQAIAKSFERTLIYLAQNGASCQTLYELQERLNSKYKSKIEKQMDINFKVRSEEARQNLSKTSRERLKTISFQSPRIKSVWQHPLQENEFYIFYQLSYWIARQLDRGIPGHSNRSQPCLNLRIFSNPYVFFLTLFIAMYLMKCLLDL